jgi:hypothetical protein
MKEVTTKILKEYIKTIDKEIPIKIYCSYNEYEVKRVILWDDRLVFEVGETENPIEDGVYEGPILA